MALVSPLFAANYIVSNVISGDGSSDALYQKANNSLLSGGVAALGFFPAGYVISTNVADIQATITAFLPGLQASSPVGGLSGDLGAAMAGYVQAAPVSGPAILIGNVLVGRPLYVFVGDGATLAGSTQWGLKQVATIAADEPLTQDYLANPLGGTAPVIGSVGAYTGNASGFGSSTYQTLKMVAIPEASTALLGALGALGLLRRRR